MINKKRYNDKKENQKLNNKIWKAREYLDWEKYHLCSDSNGNWALFKRYEDWKKYMSPNNKAIMDSEHNTVNELIKFAKKNRMFQIKDLIIYMNIAFLIEMWICFIIQYFVKEFRIVTLTVDALWFIYFIISATISKHNAKILDKEFEELVGNIKE